MLCQLTQAWLSFRTFHADGFRPDMRPNQALVRISRGVLATSPCVAILFGADARQQAAASSFAPSPTGVRFYDDEFSRGDKVASAFDRTTGRRHDHQLLRQTAADMVADAPACLYARLFQAESDPSRNQYPEQNTKPRPQKSGNYNM